MPAIVTDIGKETLERLCYGGGGTRNTFLLRRTGSPTNGSRKLPGPFVCPLSLGRRRTLIRGIHRPHKIGKRAEAADFTGSDRGIECNSAPVALGPHNLAKGMDRSGPELQFLACFNAIDAAELRPRPRNLAQGGRQRPAVD